MRKIKKIMNMGGIYRENRKIKNKGELREPNKENLENYNGKKCIGVKKEIKGDREQFQKRFHTFANYWNFQTI